MMRQVYLDHNATTPVHPRVAEAMLPFLREAYGNPSSLHWAGRAARQAVDAAREAVARLVGAEPAEVVFTSGATEADNLALRGVAELHPGGHIVTTAVEHPAVRETCAELARRGWRVTVLPVDRAGRLDLAQLEAALTADTCLVSAMLANNETGVLFPAEAIGRLCRSRGILFHCDATQAVGKVPVDMRRMGIDLLALSGHKLNGPKGVGALVVRKGVKLKPQQTGGHQERGRRGGTENVPGVVGLGEAARLAAERLAAGEPARVAALRDRLERRILAAIPEVLVNGQGAERVPNTLNCSFRWVEGEALLLSLDLAGIAVSSGSACSAGSLEPSHVLLAMGLTREEASGAVRFSLGYETTEGELDYVVETLPPIVERLRAISPFAPAGVA
ncbi:MAG TPA: cysteine desulfurase NifS [Thermodesulfobacteriota bacterium]|nr:cysteine desulfurase NifS [Thermodesulfobacteriota bacterium]